jgi:hypothetical protein
LAKYSNKGVQTLAKIRSKIAKILREGTNFSKKNHNKGEQTLAKIRSKIAEVGDKLQ